MKTKDQLWRGTARNNQFRVLAVEASQTIQTARDIHDLSPLATLLVGKMISAAALLSLDLKTIGSEISLRVEGDGLLKGATVTCTQSGNLRCLAFEPHLFLDDIAENLHPGKYLGKGTLSVYLAQRGKRQVAGHVQLVDGEIAEDLAHYYLQSEQIPTAVNLGVLIAPDASIKAGGGILIQQLPNADPENVEDLIRNISQTPNISDLMDMGLSIGEIVQRFYFPKVDLDIKPCRSLQYRCNCSRVRFSNALKLLGKQELSEMLEGIEPVCNYCNKTYTYTNRDIARLIQDLEEKQ